MILRIKIFRKLIFLWSKVLFKITIVIRLFVGKFEKVFLWNFCLSIILNVDFNPNMSEEKTAAQNPLKIPLSELTSSDMSSTY